MQNDIEISIKSFWVPVTKRIAISEQDWLTLYAASNYTKVPPESIEVSRMVDIFNPKPDEQLE